MNTSKKISSIMSAVIFGGICTLLWSAIPDIVIGIFGIILFLSMQILMDMADEINL